MSSLSLKMSLLQNPHFYIVLVLFALKSISGSDLNETNSNQRDSRQLFTLLKNILKVQQPAAAATGGQEETPYYATSQYPGGGGIEQKIHSANINPEFQHQYPMLNYQTQQHSSVPLYNNLQQREELLPTTNNGQSSTNLLNSPINSGGGGVGGLLSMISKLGAPEDVDLSSIINFGSIEGMIGRVNRFDKLQCIPRMICQMVAKRIEDGLTTTTTTTTTTEKSVKQKKQRGGRFIKIDGMDGALDQFVKFLDVMQLRDWSLYPYVKGMKEGHQVRRASECAEKFRSCPFSEDQLVYYFNNYNGGFFQSFRNGKEVSEF